MEIQSILLQYTISDISKFILEYAFKCEKVRITNDYFELGYYEKCVEIIKDIDSLDIEKFKKNNLISKLLEDSCCGGHMRIVELMIEKNADNWNGGLHGACYGGNMKIVKLMIEKGASWWNYGLYGACQGGNMKIVKLMIEKGANNWNYGLWGSLSRRKHGNS